MATNINLQTTGVDKSYLRAACASIGLPRASQPAHLVTHLVCGDDPPRRTLKLLHALARGAWVLPPRWLSESVAAGYPLPPSQFEIHGLLPACREARRRHDRGEPGVLAGRRIAIVGATGIPRDDLAVLLTGAGAELLADHERGARGSATAPQLEVVSESGARLPLSEAEVLGAIMDARALLVATPPAPPAEVEEARSGRQGSDESLMCRAAPEAAAETPASCDADSGGGGPGGKRRRRAGKENDDDDREPCPPGRGQRRGRGLTSEGAAASAEASAASAAPPPPLELEAGRRVVFLPRPGQPGRQADSYWLHEDALALYRKRLPRCNVDVQRVDFLGVMAERGTTAVLRQGDATLAACTFVPHLSARFAEVLLLATSARHQRRGHSSALLGAVETHLKQRGVRWLAACAGLDCTAFWAKRGYCADACLPPEAWSLLVDGFGDSRVMSKEMA